MIPGASTPLDDLLASDLVDDPRRSAAAEPVRAELTARRRRQWASEARLAAAALGAMGSFVGLTRTIGAANGSAFDRALVRAVGRARHPLSNAAARGLTFFGSVGGAIAVSLGALWLTRRRPRLAGQVVSGALGGVIAELLLKRFYRRARPELLAPLEKIEGSTSFPSGHSMAAASLYLTLAFVASRGRKFRGHRGRLLGGAATFAGAVGATRVFLGVHWPTDVLGGLALGTAWACASEAAFDLAAAEHVEREARRASAPPRG